MIQLRCCQATFLAVLTLFLLACTGLPNPLAGDGHQVEGAWLGEIVTARDLADDGSPLDVTDTFAPDERIIYVVAEVKRIEENTTLSAVWYRGDEAIEESAPITADQTYEETYLEFHLAPVDETRLESGHYSVQLIINESPGPVVEFEVR